MDYDAIGPTVRLAGRMEQMASPGICRLTLNTFRLAEGYIEVNALGGIPVRGMEDPVEAFDLKGAVDFRSRFLASQRGRLTRFVGRDAGITVLEQAWKEAREGLGQIGDVKRVAARQRHLDPGSARSLVKDFIRGTWDDMPNFDSVRVNGNLYHTMRVMTG